VQRRGRKGTSAIPPSDRRTRISSSESSQAKAASPFSMTLVRSADDLARVGRSISSFQSEAGIVHPSAIDEITVPSCLRVQTIVGSVSMISRNTIFGAFQIVDVAGCSIHLIMFPCSSSRATARIRTIDTGRHRDGDVLPLKGAARPRMGRGPFLPSNVVRWNAFSHPQPRPSS